VSLPVFPLARLPRRISAPDLAVQGAVLDGLGNVLGRDAFGAGQVGNRAGHLQNAVVGAGAELEFGRRRFLRTTRRNASSGVKVELLSPLACAFKRRVWVVSLFFYLLCLPPSVGCGAFRTQRKP